MDIASTLKAKYNRVLQKWNKATAYIESKDRTLQEIDKWLPDYEFILRQRNALCMEIWRETDNKPTIEQFEGGFG